MKTKITTCIKLLARRNAECSNAKDTGKVAFLITWLKLLSIYFAVVLRSFVKIKDNALVSVIMNRKR